MKNSLIISTTITATTLMIVGLWLFLKSGLQTEKYPEQNLPDTIINEVTAIHMDENGIPQFQVKTPQTLHYTEDSSTEFVTPVITLYDPPREPIVISAETGRAFENFTIIKLYGDVLLHQGAGPNNEENHAKTSEITLYPKQKTATTDKFVQWWQDNFHIEGVGMEADLESGWINLLEHVEAIQNPITEG